MGPSILPLLLPLLLLLLHPSSSAPIPPSSPYVAGVTYTYRPNSAYTPPPRYAVRALLRHNITRVRLIDPDSSSISVFADTGIDLNLSLEDLSLLRSLASNASSALIWLQGNLSPHLPAVRVTSISVGYAVLTRHPDLSPLLLPAVTHVHEACLNLSIRGVSISTAHSFDILARSFPPSLASFNASYLPFLRDLLAFDTRTNGAFQIDAFPFHVYRDRRIPGVSMQFVMFDAHESDYLQDPTTKLRYGNLYEVMVDGIIGALTRERHPTLPVLVIGTGWPSNDNDDETSLLYAANYVDKLVGWLNKLSGTPLRPAVTPVTYVDRLFDAKDTTQDPNSYENNWGIMLPHLAMKYRIEFVPGAGGAPRAAAGRAVAMGSLAVAVAVLFGFL